ncbi:MAG TPA: RNA polymerase subunit sigma-70, partial [Planctomycetaceae bacterium]|nr:RNA polymerase subunit sigma-70 [Planctomycetaceae bacterium]
MQNSNAPEIVGLIARHQTRLRGLVRCLLVRSSDVEDVLQEVNSVLWEKASEFQYGTDFWAWA